MSRTRKGAKGPSYEYWGKRPGGIMPPGKFSKKITHKAERQQGKHSAKDSGNEGA